MVIDLITARRYNNDISIGGFVELQNSCKNTSYFTSSKPINYLDSWTDYYYYGASELRRQYASKTLDPGGGGSLAIEIGRFDWYYDKYRTGEKIANSTSEKRFPDTDYNSISASSNVSWITPIMSVDSNGYFATSYITANTTGATRTATVTFTPPKGNGFPDNGTGCTITLTQAPNTKNIPVYIRVSPTNNHGNYNYNRGVKVGVQISINGSNANYSSQFSLVSYSNNVITLNDSSSSRAIFAGNLQIQGDSLYISSMNLGVNAAVESYNNSGYLVDNTNYGGTVNLWAIKDQSWIIDNIVLSKLQEQQSIGHYLIMNYYDAIDSVPGYGGGYIYFSALSNDSCTGSSPVYSWVNTNPTQYNYEGNNDSVQNAKPYYGLIVDIFI